MRRLTGLKHLLAIDFRALALFRVALGALLGVDTLFRMGDLRAHYADTGVLPLADYWTSLANPNHLSLHFANGSVLWQGVLFTAALLAAACVVVGYRTRLAVFFGWLLLISAQNRNPLILNGGDSLLRMLYFWSLFLPLGARRSVDYSLAEARPTRSNLLFSAGSVALVLQIVMVYLVTAALKTGREWWPDGTASYFALSLREFTTPLGDLLRGFPGLLKLSTYGVYGLEASAAALILCPFYSTAVRLVTIGFLTAMHLAFASAMNIGLFPFADVAALIVLIPGEAIDWASRRIDANTSLGLIIYYDGECTFCKKMVVIIRGLLLSPRVEIRKVQDEPSLMPLFIVDPSWVVVTPAGEQYRRWAAGVCVVRHIPYVGRIFRKLPLEALAPAGNAAYRWIAEHRPLLGAATKVMLPWKDGRSFRTGRLAQTLAAYMLIYVVLLNLKTLPATQALVPEGFGALGSALRVDQKWNMFAPFPLKATGWYVIPAELKNGHKFDLVKGAGSVVTYERPERVAPLYGDARWRKYLMNLSDNGFKDQRLHYGRWLCRNWNEAHQGGEQLVTFQIEWMREATHAPDEPPAPTEKYMLWKHNCFK